MRYILDSSGYIEEVSFSNEIVCHNDTCTEYTGSIPSGYNSLSEWSVNANIRAYKIVNGDLTYDSVKDAELQSEWSSQEESSVINVYNETTTSTNDTYSCDYINNLNTYSTTEQVVGTWINGKNIYIKAYTGTTQSSSGDLTLEENVEAIIDYCIIINRASNPVQKHPINSAMMNNDSNHANPLYIKGTNLNLYLSNSAYLNKPYSGWIKYTKTTD